MMRGKAGDIASATLTAVVDLGGDFGISGAIGAVEGGAVAGLFKGIAREFPSLHVRVVDAPKTVAPSQLAVAVVEEMQDAAGPVEVGLVNGRRATVVPCEQRPQSGKPLASLARGSVWIVTGGARGVTSECARELGRRHGLVLALVGSTSPVAVDSSWLALDEAGLKELKGRVMLDARGQGTDPRSAWRKVEKSIEIEKSLARFRKAGVDARYFACDLADEAAVRSLVQRVARELGPVRGVLHGAGFESACRFEKKTLEGLAATLGPKCVGIEHLLASLDPAALEAVVGFGSTSGRLGGHGQADYSLANDMLAKILGARRQRGLRATVFHWHAWDEVGMASRPESRFVLEQFGLKFMPLAEGVRRFMNELEAGLPDAEVLVTEPACVPEAVAAGAPAAPGKRGSLVAGLTAGATSTEVTFQLDPNADRFLLDHLQFGRPLLPAVMGAELLAQAAIASGACGEVQEIRDFTVERPIAFPTDQPRQVKVELAAADKGAVEAVGYAATEQRPAIRGVVSTEAAAPIVEKKSEPPLPFNPMVYADDAPLRHGASFRTLTGLFLDRTGGWGRLVAPAADVVAAPRGAGGWTVPAALLDGCIVACAVYSYILCGLRVEVPVKFERLRITGRPRSGETCIARLVFRSNDVRESVYDLVLFGDDGRAILALDGLHLAIMGAEKGRG
jgi:NAD(P)-dependent dehydrogenase (short-subunit alcohol dehydrogenase family)